MRRWRARHHAEDHAIEAAAGADELSVLRPDSTVGRRAYCVLAAQSTREEGWV